MAAALLNLAMYLNSEIQPIGIKMKKVESLNFKYIPLFLVLWMMIKYFFLHQRGKIEEVFVKTSETCEEISIIKFFEDT